MSEVLGNASVQYNDMVGTVAIDGPDQPGALYELVGLDPGEWSVVAYDIYGGYEATWVYVWAVPYGSVSYNDWHAAAAEGERASQGTEVPGSA